MKKVLLAIVVLLIAGASYCGYRMLAVKKELRPAADRVFAQLRDGHADVVFDEATPEFRASTTKRGLRRYYRLREAALGEYRGVGDITGYSIQTGSKEVGRMEIAVRFAKETVTAELEFVKDGPRWRLALLKIPIPEQRLPKIAAADAEQHLRGLITLYNGGNAEVIHASFDATLQTEVPLERFAAQLAKLRQVAGKIVDVTTIEAKTLSTGTYRHEVNVAFENGPGTGHFEYIVIGDKWLLVGFHLDRPGR
jgi:hypothetical protein